ncbi:DLW-39 family protein [Protofrankia symbiont of Coriaria ruscifolia]|nr:DLW-39 family protein [Protofrankia symbiont of Coriaria ruscifolia]
MFRKLVVLAVVASAGAVATVVRRRRGRGEVDLWHEATTAINTN